MLGIGVQQTWTEADDLWEQVAMRLHSACGWSLRPITRLGRPRENRRTWLAEGEPGTIIVKAVSNPFVAAKAAWTLDALSLLAKRGYPVPQLLWQGSLDERWSVVVQARLPGEPLGILAPPTLEQLLALVDLQAEPNLAASGAWDVSWWTSVIIFEGWEHWWDGAMAAAPETSRRLRAFLEPVWGHRLPVSDIVHGDLNLTNVLTHHGAISGVVDWDHIGLGSRATGLTGLLFDWHRLRLDDPGILPVGGDRLIGRIVEIVGRDGLRCTVTYGAIARIALSAQRGEHRNLAIWRQVTDEIIASLGWLD
jgi:Ser/Thr protein kinase RdoA (MazF antagonist)